MVQAMRPSGTTSAAVKTYASTAEVPFCRFRGRDSTMLLSDRAHAAVRPRDPRAEQAAKECVLPGAGRL
jgi:hypothetical protein